MRYTLEHITRYHYSKPVVLEPHTVRLRNDGAHDVEQFAMRFDPQPAGFTDTLDPEGNAITRAWFHGPTQHLTITTHCSVVTRRSNPFDFIIPAESQRLPLAYPADLVDRLAIYRRRETFPGHAGSSDDPVAAFAHQLADEVNHDTLRFLTELTHRLNRDIRIEIRETGDPFTPQQTLAEACGACRDTAVLFIDICRTMGLAARFVSGYQEGDPTQDRRDLHAWAEVYLPLAGWRGYDPTLGLVIADRHIPLAASHHPIHAAPVTGSFRGEGEASLVHHVHLATTPSSPAGQQQAQQ